MNKGQKVFNLWDGLEKPYFKENKLEEYEEGIAQNQLLDLVTKDTPTASCHKLQE